MALGQNRRGAELSAMLCLDACVFEAAHLINANVRVACTACRFLMWNWAATCNSNKLELFAYLLVQSSRAHMNRKCVCASADPARRFSDMLGEKSRVAIREESWPLFESSLISVNGSAATLIRPLHQYKSRSQLAVSH